MICVIACGVLAPIDDRGCVSNNPSFRGHTRLIISSLGSAVIIRRPDFPTTQCIYEYLISEYARVESSCMSTAFLKRISNEKVPVSYEIHFNPLKPNGYYMYLLH
jgi:hypothetical protein